MRNRTESVRLWANTVLLGQGNLSSFDGDLSLIKLRQIIQEHDEKKEEKNKPKTRQKRLGEIGDVVLNVCPEGSVN